MLNVIIQRVEVAVDLVVAVVSVAAAVAALEFANL
jgi:hypothetical protein